MDGVEVWGLLLLVAGSFVATNLDNLVILVLLLGANRGNRLPVIMGFVCSACSALLIASAGVMIGIGTHPERLGYLGLIPLGLGLFLLFKPVRARGASAASEDYSVKAGTSGGWLGSYLLLASNSGDSIALFLPLLAESHNQALLVIVGGFLFMTVLWATLAWHISGQTQFARRMEKVGEKLVPWIMMAVGIYILLDTGTDSL